jgi:hypothetical protein
MIKAFRTFQDYAERSMFAPAVKVTREVFYQASRECN